MARALLLVRGVRPTILAATAFALAACSSSNPGQQFDAGTSPGTVTLRLNIPSTRSFCDPVQYGVCDLQHITIATAAGEQLVVTGAGPCGRMICSSQCVAPPCAAGVCISGGPLGPMVQLGWDGSYFEPSTCGSSTPCAYRKFVPPGQYVAHMCATPGTISEGVDGGTANCAATGPSECVDVPFDLPGPSLVEATLP